MGFWTGKEESGTAMSASNRVPLQRRGPGKIPPFHCRYSQTVHILAAGVRNGASAPPRAPSSVSAVPGPFIPILLCIHHASTTTELEATRTERGIN